MSICAGASGRIAGRATSALARLLLALLAGAVSMSTPALLAPAMASAQEGPEEWRELLVRVVPEADRFTERQGEPPVFEAYRSDPSSGQETLAGYAFLTSDMPPEQMGFNGPIEVLVGMDPSGLLTGIVVLHYIESLRRSRGDFLATEGFQEQFRGKAIGDAFQVRRDVDAVTGATITVDAMSRGIRDAAREVAVAYGVGSMSSASEATLLDPVSISLDELERLSWTQLLLRGLAQQILVLDQGRTATDLTLVYLRDESVAEVLLGPDLLEAVLERAGPAARERHLVLAGADGAMAGALNLARISIAQAGDTVGLSPSDVLLFGPPRQGKLDGQVRFVRVLLVDPAVDMTQPLTFVLDLRPGFGVFSAEYPGERATAGQSGAGPTVGATAPPGGEADAEQSDPEASPTLTPSFDDSSPRNVALVVLLALATAVFVAIRIR